MSAAAEALRPTKKRTVWEWACEEVVFPDTSVYPSARPGRFDPDFLPMYKEPMEAVTDPDVREIVVVGGSQTAKTEMMLLMPLRYHLACDPIPAMYIGGQQESTEAFIEERIKPGMTLSRETARKMRGARIRGTEIYFEDMALAGTWSTSSQGLKSRPLGLVLNDELSIWPANSLEKARKRTDTFPFAHLVVVSAPDTKGTRPSSQDPIWIEFENTDKRELHLKDPKTGKWFVPHFGLDFEKGSQLHSGVRWDPDARRADGSWNLDRVRESAYYLCPSGAKITSKRKKAWIDAGKWVATNRANARKGRRGYRVSGLLMPWKDWGDIAVGFLEHKARGVSSLRVFVGETLVEKWKERTDAPEESLVSACQGDYPVGFRLSERPQWEAAAKRSAPMVLMSVDVQQASYWWVVREWLAGGESGLVTWGQADTWADIDRIARKWKAAHVLVDSGYGERNAEVLQACAELKMIPTRGADRRMQVPIMLKTINPYEGTSRQALGLKMGRIDYDADLMKDQLFELVKREREAWWVPKGIEREYALQMSSESRSETGAWTKIRGNNHLWDCEVIQVVGAIFFGFLGRPELTKPEDEEKKEAA